MSTTVCSIHLEEQTLAVTYFPECDESHCADCGTVHEKMKMTRLHVVIVLYPPPLSPIPTPTPMAVPSTPTPIPNPLLLDPVPGKITCRNCGTNVSKKSFDRHKQSVVCVTSTNVKETQIRTYPISRMVTRKRREASPVSPTTTRAKRRRDGNI